jgi:carboxylesterase
MAVLALAILAVMALGARAVYPRILERREGRRLSVGGDGIVPGAAAIEQLHRDAPGVLLLHGGGDTPQVLAELAQYLHGHGFSVRVPLLSGHGRTLPELAAVTAAQWHQDAEREFDAMRATHSWVGIVGLSLGGALAVKLASERRDVRALVLLAPYIDMPPTVRGMAATTFMWGWMLPYFSAVGGKSIRDPAAAARALGRGLLTPAALRALYDVVCQVETALARVSAPTLVIQSREDNRISRPSAERAFAQLGSTDKKLVWTEGAGHVISVDFGRERVFELTGDWLSAHRSVSS